MDYRTDNIVLGHFQYCKDRENSTTRTCKLYTHDQAELSQLHETYHIPSLNLVYIDPPYCIIYNINENSGSLTMLMQFAVSQAAAPGLPQCHIPVRMLSYFLRVWSLRKVVC